MPNHYFSDTELHLRVRNILRAPIQNICCTDCSLLDWVTLRAQKGQGYFVAGPGFGCTSPDIWRSRSRVRSGRLRSGFVVTSRISSAAAN